MRLVLVHGINQQGKSSQQIRDDWMGYLGTVYAGQGVNPLARVSRCDAAFYGDKLDQLSEASVSSRAIALGAEETTDDLAEFSLQALNEMALKLGATKAELESEFAQTFVAQGSGLNKKWIKAIVRVIERASPGHGVFALRLLTQAHAYIRNKNVHDEVNNLVRPLFEDDEPLIIVSHSLGTVISYSLLREFSDLSRPRQSPLFLTLGSPLGIDSVRRGFAKPRIRPRWVRRWVNASDPNDFVALRPELSIEDYGEGVENYINVNNGKDSHAAAGYLTDTWVAGVIEAAIP
jgi:hypothetical protein